MRHPDSLRQEPDAGARLRVSMVEMDLPDKLVDLVGENVFAPTLDFGPTVIATDKNGCRTSRTKLARV
jgi:hypothetical protein